MDYRTWDTGQRAFVYTLGLMSKLIRGGVIHTYDGSTKGGRADYDKMVNDGYKPKAHHVTACVMYLAKDEQITETVKDWYQTNVLDVADEIEPAGKERR